MEEATPAVILVPTQSNKRGAAHTSSSSSCWVAPQPKRGARRRSRSRSPGFRPGLPGLRKHAPSRLERRPAAMPYLSVAAVREVAIAKLEHDVKADTTHESDDSRLRSITSWLAEWGCDFSSDAGFSQGTGSVAEGWRVPFSSCLSLGLPRGGTEERPSGGCFARSPSAGL